MDDIEMQVDHATGEDTSPVMYQASTAMREIVLPIHGCAPTTKRNQKKKQRLAEHRHTRIGKSRTNHSRRTFTRPLSIQSSRRTRGEKQSITTTLTVTQYRLADIYLRARELEFRLPPLRPFDSPGTSKSHSLVNEIVAQQAVAQPTITIDSLNAALKTPIAGLILPAPSPFDMDTVTELARAICVAPGVIRTKPSEPLDQNGISSVIKHYVRTILSSLLCYYKNNPSYEDPAETGNTDWPIAFEHLDKSMARKWLKAQPVRLLEEKVVQLLHAQGHKLDAQGSLRLQLAIEPATIWPDLHPGIYAYMDRYRLLMGVSAINPSTLMTLIDYFVSARKEYIANINKEPSTSMPRLPRWQQAKSVLRSSLNSVSTDNYRDMDIDGLAGDSSDDLSDDELMDDAPPSDASMNDLSLSDADPDSDPSQVEGGSVQDGGIAFLNVLDQWILHKKKKQEENDVDEAMELDKMAFLELKDPPPKKRGLEMMLEARGIKKGGRRRG